MKRQNILTQSDAAVLQQVAQVVKHGFLVLPANTAEIAQEATTASYHLGEGDLLWKKKVDCMDQCAAFEEASTK